VPKKFVVTIMLGMNRFTQRDDEHPFDMSLAECFNTLWLPQVSEIEKTHSTPFYEMTKTMHEFINEYNKEYEITDLTKDDVLFICGRGTIGSGSEDSLYEALLEAKRTYGKNAYYIFYTKSFGVVDTLRTFNDFQETMQRQPIGADLMFLIDGAATPISKASVSKIYKSGNKKGERRFIIPKNVRKAFGIVQRRKGFKGLLVGKHNDSRCHNFIVRQPETSKYVYSAYSDGYERKLDASHFNMEEIVSTVPCCRFGGRTYTVNEMVKYFCNRYMLGKV